MNFFQMQKHKKLLLVLDICIGDASYGSLRHVPPQVNFQLFNFSGHFRAAQTLTFDSTWLHIKYKKAQLSLTNPRDACEKFARFT